MASLAALRKQAKELGVPKAMILRAETPEELQQIVSDFQSDDGGSDEPKSAPRKKVVAKKKSHDAPQKKQTRKPTAKKSGSTRAPAKSAKGTAKRRGTAKDTPKRSNGYVPKGGRNLLEKVNFSQTDGWNPRKGSPPALIIAALKKAKGNRQSAFEALRGDVWNFVGKKKADGSKRTKAEAEDMLRYRISRTLFDFAIRTGQHESATNRVQYGTGGTGNGSYAPKKAPRTKTATKTASRQKGAQSRTKAATKKATPKRKATARR